MAVFVSVAPPQRHSCQSLDIINLDPPAGYIGKQTLEGSGVYLDDCLWSIEVPTGQRVSLILYSVLYGQTRKRPNPKG